jgi:hypothetical protein
MAIRRLCQAAQMKKRNNGRTRTSATSAANGRSGLHPIGPTIDIEYCSASWLAMRRFKRCIPPSSGGRFRVINKM